MNIFLACTKTKADKKCAAKDMYTSDLFKKSYQYAEKLGGNIWILSAKYGLLSPGDIIAPYNQTLVGASEMECKKWAYKVYCQMVDKQIDFEEEAIFLCGTNYRKYLITKFKKASAPLAHMGIGRQLKFYKENSLNENQ